jgi:hypothetical protein
MSTLNIDGVGYTLYISNIKQSSGTQEEKHDFYNDIPFIGSVFAKPRKLTISFVIYDNDREDIARDLEAHFRNKSQFLVWISEYNIIQGYKYIIARPDSIEIPKDSETPVSIAGTMTIEVAGYGNDYGFLANNYVRITYQTNDWDIEGAT